MTLHKATEIIKKIFIGICIGIGTMIVITLIFRIGLFIRNVVAPPKIKPPNQAYGDLPAIPYPVSNINNNFTYTLNTISGTLPNDFPDRLIVYPIIEQSPNLLSLDKTKAKVQALGFVDQQRQILPEISQGMGKYEWDEQIGINRKIIFDTVTFDFSLLSTYLSSLTVLGAQNLQNETNAIKTTQEFLTSIGLLSSDIDLTKTQTPQPDISYATYPKLYTIQNGSLVPTTSLSNAKVIRVDLYQQDVTYDLDTGAKDVAKIKMQIPILYPNPPFSTMSFWIASGQNKPEVVAAEFVHQNIEVSPLTSATYPIKTVQTAFDQLKQGKAYIASYSGSSKEITIKQVYLAYYLGSVKQKYLMPIIVFEGSDNFIAYVSAVNDDWVK